MYAGDMGNAVIKKKARVVSAVSADKMDCIVQTGAKVLRETATEISIKDINSPHVVHLIDRMKKLLSFEKHGVALAAPQAGEALRLFIVAGRVFQHDEKIKDIEENPDKDAEVKKKTPPPDRIFINPVITRHSRTQSVMEEGCLSVQGLYGSVVRYEKATVHALGEHGKKIVYHASGLLAQIFQHEIDHLNGVLYTDKVVTLEKVKEKTPVIKEIKETAKNTNKNNK